MKKFNSDLCSDPQMLLTHFELQCFWLLWSSKQINFLFVANVVFQCYHFSKQFLSNLSKIKYLAFFITFCFVVSLAKMVTLTNNIVYKKSAQYRKYIWLELKSDWTRQGVYKVSEQLLLHTFFNNSMPSCFFGLAGMFLASSSFHEVGGQ